MKQKVELSPQEAKLIVRALFALNDEAKFSAVDRINQKIRKAFGKTNKWLGDLHCGE